MIKERRTYLPRIVGDKVMMPADLKRLHKYMLEIEHIDEIVVRHGERGNEVLRHERPTPS